MQQAPGRRKFRYAAAQQNEEAEKCGDAFLQIALNSPSLRAFQI
jgi:hypothetical protein